MSVTTMSVTTTGTATAAGHVNPVLRTAPAPPAEAAAYFRASLAFHTDVSDVAAALATGGDPGFVLVDCRSTESWDQGHVPGAVHLPTALVAERAGELLDPAVPVVTYCWGPACNGATRASSPSPNSVTGSRRCSAASSTGCARASSSRPGRAPSGPPPTP